MGLPDGCDSHERIMKATWLKTVILSGMELERQALERHRLG